MHRATLADVLVTRLMQLGLLGHVTLGIAKVSAHYAGTEGSLVPNNRITQSSIKNNFLPCTISNTNQWLYM